MKLDSAEVPRYFNLSCTFDSLVDPYKIYRQLVLVTSTTLIVVSVLGVIILLFGSLLSLGYSKSFSVMLMGALFVHIVAIVVVWVLSWRKWGASRVAGRN